MIERLPPDLVQRFRRDWERLAGASADAIGVAVSGGPDSLALLLLACAAFPRRISAATVDHRLRPESAAEAAFVAEICDRLSVPHSTLPVDVDPRRSSVQRAAREARYRALAGWCGDRSLGWLATAHHLDDQAETLMMRLLRGSGVAGLAGVRPVGPLPGSAARLVRPLLGWRRERLAETVAAAGLRAVDDPSNADPAYDRVRIRARLAASPWIDPEALARSAAALAEADGAIAWATDRAWRERVEADGQACRFAPDGLPQEIVRRILVRIVTEAGAAPRADEIARLAATLAAGGVGTLGGLLCRGGNTWRFEAEPPRRQSKSTRA